MYLGVICFFVCGAFQFELSYSPSFEVASKQSYDEIQADKSASGAETLQYDGTSLTSPFEFILQGFLDELLSLLLGAKESELAASLWSVPKTLERLRKFANDTSVHVIFLSKILGAPADDYISECNRSSKNLI